MACVRISTWIIALPGFQPVFSTVISLPPIQISAPETIIVATFADGTDWRTGGASVWSPRGGDSGFVPEPEREIQAAPD